MSRYPRIAAALYQEPWQITPGKFHEITHAFEKARSNPDWMAADDPVGPEDEDWDGNKFHCHPQVQTLGPVALVPVHGVTGRGLSRLAMQCGGYDTGLLRQQLRNIAEDPSIRALVLDIHSPGGQAAGNSAVAADIAAIRANGIATYAWTSGMMCSAAYWIGSACQEIYADPDAIVGSISTIYAGVDDSAEWAKEGRKLELFATGKFKATGMSGKAWTDEERAMIWERVGKIDAEFKNHVRSARPLLGEDALEGQWWYAKHAPAGLIDSTSFDNLQSLLESIYTTI